MRKSANPFLGTLIPAVGMSMMMGESPWTAIKSQTIDPFVQPFTENKTFSAKSNLMGGLTPGEQSHFRSIMDNTKSFYKFSGRSNMLKKYMAQDIADKAMQKTAGLFSLAQPPLAQTITEGLKHVKPWLQAGVWGAGAGILGSHLLGGIHDKYKKHHAYKDMFVKFPELQEADPVKVDDYWNLMSDFAPEMTKNPLVAGQFIKQMIDFGMRGVDAPTLKNIIDIQGAVDKKKGEGLKNVGAAIGAGSLL